MKTTKEIVTDIIKELGIPASIKGYHYTRYAVMLILESPSLMHCITKALYPTVAKEFNTTSSKVERAIRHGIQTSWNRGNIELRSKLFGYTIDKEKGTPTNSEYIATIADYICMMDGE